MSHLAPGIPENLRCSVDKTSSVLCTWSAPRISNGLIRNYTLQYHEVGKVNVVKMLSTGEYIPSLIAFLSTSDFGLFKLC